MKFTKKIDGKVVTLEETNENIFNILEREGFKPVKEKQEKQEKVDNEE